MSEIGKEYLKNEINQPQDNPPVTSSEQALSNFQSDKQGVYDQLTQFFNEQDHQRKTIEEAREILGESASSLSDEQVFDLVNEIQYLADTWLEEYEKKVFNGKTLNELLQLE